MKTKVFYNGRQINGRYDSLKAKAKRFYRNLKIATYWAGAFVIAVAITTSFVATSNAHAEAPKTIDLTPQKIADLKSDLVHRLSQCESAGHGDDYGLITFDQNKAGTLSARNTPSIGPLQFKITTLQTFYKQRTGKEISGRDAVVLALGYDTASDLASYVIFETKGGIYNWANCATKLNLVAEVEVLKRITN